MSFLNCVDMLMAEVLCLYVFSSKVEKLLNCVFRNLPILLIIVFFWAWRSTPNPRAGWFEHQCSTGWDEYHLVTASTNSNYT